MAAEADLILTMTRGHRKDVLHRAPRVLARSFTLREAADLLAGLGEEAAGAGEDIAERARRLVQAMAAARSHRNGGSDDDIVDPINRPIDVHQEVAEAVVASLLPVLQRIARCDTPVTDGARTSDDSGAPPGT
jgi:protein-tyrosine-phosphatase